MRTAVIVHTVRTPIGKNGGKLAGWHPVDLAAEVLGALVARSRIDPGLIEDVIMGCTMQVGEQAMNIGRNAVLAAGFPESIPGTTVDRQCGSSQQAIHFAAQAVIAGANDVVIAGGVESMSRVPIGSTTGEGFGNPYGGRLGARYRSVGGFVHQGVSAEMIAEKWGLSRRDLDVFSLQSHQKAAAAEDAGRFADEILPVRCGEDNAVITRDEGIRRDTSLQKLSTLPTIFKEGGRVTAGSSSQISDGCAAMLIMEEATAVREGFTPLARFHAFAVGGADPRIMLTAPIPTTAKILEKTGMNIDDFAAIEINEAFASVVLAWERELHADMTKVNVNGGAIALGHPTGASGARLMTTLVHELRRRRGRWGLQTMCEGGGMANATIIESYD